MPSLSLRSQTAKRPRRGVKARRRTELGLMVAAGVIVLATYVLMILGNTSKVPSDLTPLLLAILALGGLTHLANRVFAPDSNAVVMPIVFLLNGLGYVMITRIDLGKNQHYAPLQAAWTAAGVAGYVLTLFVVPVIYGVLARFTKSPEWTARKIEEWEAQELREGGPKELPEA